MKREYENGIKKNILTQSFVCVCRLTACLIILFIAYGCISGFPVSNTNVHKNISLKGKIAILPSSQQLFNTLLPDALANEFISKGIVVVERNELSKILSEYKLSLSGILESSDYYQIGKLANIDYIVLVNSRELLNGSVASAVIKIIDPSSSKVVISTTYSQPRPENSNYVAYHNINTTAKSIVDSIYNALNNK